MAKTHIINVEEVTDKLVSYVEEADVPFVEEFCLSAGISIESLHRLRRKPENKRLCDAWKRLKLKQKFALIQGGLTKMLSERFVMFLLNVNHKMVERASSKVDVTSAGEKIHGYSFEIVKPKDDTENKDNETV